MKKSYYLGLDIGGTKCAVSVGEIESNHIRILERSETPTTNNPTETLKHLSPCIRAYLEKYPIQAAGISCGGTADALVSGSSVARRVGSNPVIRTKQRGCTLGVCPFCFIRMVGFEIGRKLQSNLSVGPNS